MNKFFNNINYKNIVIYFSSLLLTTSIVCPLTSCGSDDTSNDIGGFDKEFGFDAQTYNNLEKQFISKYGAYLWNITKDKDEYINKFDNFFQNDLTILRNKLFDPAQNYSFTVRTNALIDYASKNYNIQLNRNTNVSDIDFDNLKQSSLENFVIYMENIGFTNVEIDEKKVEFNNTFDEILEKCKSKSTDNAQILMQLRADVINCWQDVNDELAYLSAYNHLKKFFDEYEFVVKDQKDNANYLWDFLLITPGFMGGKENCGKIDQDINCEITDYWIGKLFTISKKTEKIENKDTTENNNLNDASSDKSSSYDSYDKEKIIPGFILTPVLKTMSQDIYSNNYYMNIDWQLMYAKYQDKDQETKNKVTAHLAYNKNGKPVDYADFKDSQLSSDNYQFTRYSLLATTRYQQEKMTDAYFDQTKESGQKIAFSWDEDKIGIEYFLPSNVFSGENGKYNLPQDEYKVPMTENNLSLIGLKLNNINLSDILNKQKNLQDNKSTNDINNDDNLTIEEKFVKYCDINANTIVKFNDTTDISKNNITNKFINVYKNTNLPDEVKIEQHFESDNIKKSKNFANNAILFFNKIVNFVDTNKITTEVDSSAKLSGAINAEIWIMLTITLLFFLELIRELIYGVRWYDARPQRGQPDPNIPRGWKVKQIYEKWTLASYILTIVILILMVGLASTWLIFIAGPIKQQNQNVKKWNDEITNKSKSDINIIKKVNGTDRDNFESSENFDKYFENNQFDAFRSFFYYSHFNDLISKNNEESSKDDIRKEIDNDYKQFIDKKNENDVTIDMDIEKYVYIIIASLVLVVMIMWYIYYLIDFFRYRNRKLQKQAEFLAQHPQNNHMNISAFGHWFQSIRHRLHL